nr:arginine--tRNA ligase [Tenuifilaceae bacterium]
MSTEQFIQEKAQRVIESLYGVKPDISLIQIQKTRKEFEGDYTLVAFPLLKMSKKSPEITCQEIGDALTKSCPDVKGFNVVKGFLNISLSLEYWASVLNSIIADKEFGFKQSNSNDKPVVVEF